MEYRGTRCTLSTKSVGTKPKVVQETTFALTLSFHKFSAEYTRKTTTENVPREGRNPGEKTNPFVQGKGE